MNSDGAVWTLFVNDRVALEDIEIQPDQQVKAILTMLKRRSGYIYSPNHKTDKKRRKVICRGRFLWASPEEISKELDR